MPTQLAALLGKKKVAQIRKTDENPPRISIIDVIATISGKDKNHAAEDLRRISTGHPEVNAICVDFKFPGRGQRDTPVTDANGIVEITMQLVYKSFSTKHESSDFSVSLKGVS